MLEDVLDDRAHRSARRHADFGAFSADRLDLEDDAEVDLESIGAEGTEVSVPARGSVRPIIQDILKHLCSSISYGGASSLAELRQMFRADPMRYLVKLSSSAKRESYER